MGKQNDKTQSDIEKRNAKHDNTIYRATELSKIILHETYPKSHQISRKDFCLEQVYDKPRRRLWSASSQRLIVRRNRLRTAVDRAFGAAAPPRLWNSLPADVVASQTLATFKERQKHFCSNSHTNDAHRLCHLPLQP